jgi:hypothetical protein
MQTLSLASGKAIPSLPIAVKKIKFTTCRYPNGHFHNMSGVPINHNEHKILSHLPWSLPYLKQSEVPVEGPNIIYEVLAASTAPQRGIDPLGKAFS